MNTFLEQQHLRNKEHRQKVARKVFFKLQRVSFVILVWFGFVGAIYGVYYLLFEYGLFRMKEIEVDGVFTHTSAEQLKKSAGVKAGVNLFAISLSDVQKRILQDPWVMEAAVARKLSGVLWIYANEHQPSAILAADELYFVDADGEIFKKVEPQDEKDMPVITGMAVEADLKPAVELTKTYLASPLSDYFQLSEVSVSEGAGYSLVIGADGAVLKLGFDRMEQKLERLYSMLGAIENGGGKIRYVDLNMPGKVVVKYDKG